MSRSTIILLVGSFLIMWYSGIARIDRVDVIKKRTLTRAEAKETIKYFRKDKLYTEKREYAFLKKRTIIPFVWEKDTIFDRGLTYESEYYK